MSRMLDEIRQQPESLARTLTSELRRAEKFKAVMDRRKPRLAVLVARGTSDNAAQFGRYLIEITTGIPVSLAAPSVFTIYGARMNYKDALVVAISQSGESDDTNVVLEQAAKAGAVTVGITNEPRSTLANLAEHLFLVRAGRERSVAATKTYTGQLMAFYLVAWALGAKIRVKELEAIPDYAAAALTLETEIAAMAERYRFMHHAVAVGRGLNYANAFEFALKMKETSYVIAEGFSSADFLHGPIAMVDPSFPAFLFTPSGPTWPSIEEMLIRLRDLKAETVVITDRRNLTAANYASRVISIPARIPEAFSPIPYIIPAQLFAAALAAEKGLDPDRPRALSKITRNI
ncbi:MAG TPA: SIS domain-containing protein [Bryobacteraceae bacterium]|jgi:glucosamine--fructose-6-phosphate aminotransferase (isomerizing)|nr:SIS domain-containing protein [Bryobacteraceae bacterium]